MSVIDVPALRRRITEPVEEQYHKYPVLLIPSEKQGEALVIGPRKAAAICRHIAAIQAFLARHPEQGKENAP